ncbi:hypothetical protein LCL96_15560 [Rossellomorea aquimaris]|uniref:hypothetical protein n=1 Tax=Rossellomorea aquimaris TaxID=189382 RepID=UPI001CD22935|nr:hypothetical protein [Rossellomorea aquimaris]MCA1060355.1 hypothetical protein [Rossellomorea aquimaris]
MKSEATSKKWTFFRTVPLAIILLISLLYLFDEDPFNNDIGWFMMILFWLYKGLFDLIEDKRNGNKKSMIGNAIFVFAATGVLVWQIGTYLAG